MVGDNFANDPGACFAFDAAMGAQYNTIGGCILTNGVIQMEGRNDGES